MSAEVYSDPPIGSPGSPADAASANPIHTISATLAAATLPGLFVTQGAVDKTADLLNDDDDALLGLVVKTERLAMPTDVDADGVIQAGVTVGLARTGRRNVYIDGAFTPASRLYVRYVAAGSQPVGSLSVDADAGKNRLIPRQAIRVVTSGEDEIGVVELTLNADADAPATDS